MAESKVTEKGRRLRRGAFKFIQDLVEKKKSKEGEEGEEPEKEEEVIEKAKEE